MTRDENGRIMAGPMDQELKDKISRGQAARHRRQRAAQATVDPPTRKRCSNADCTRAGQWLRVPEDFYMRRRKLKSGGIRVYPSGECKNCSRARADAWKKGLGKEEAKRRQDSYDSKRDPERKNRYNREYLRLKAFEEAAKGERILRGPWKRYRDEPQPRERVPARGFLKWYVQERERLRPVMQSDATKWEGSVADHWSKTKWRDYLGINSETVNTLERYSRLLPEDQLTRTLDFTMVDRILTNLNLTHLTVELTDWRYMA